MRTPDVCACACACVCVTRSEQCPNSVTRERSAGQIPRLLKSKKLRNTALMFSLCFTHTHAHACMHARTRMHENNTLLIYWLSRGLIELILNDLICTVTGRNRQCFSVCFFALRLRPSLIYVVSVFYNLFTD